MGITRRRFFSLVMIEALSAFSVGYLNNTRDCNDSCSRQVNCTISPYTSGFCGAEGYHRTNGTHGPDFAAKPVGLIVNTSRDSEYTYIHLSWKPPEDGSYNYLTGFFVQVSTISLDRANYGAAGTTCFRVLPAPNWYQTHRSLQKLGGVSFFMNCLRFPVHSRLDIVISIHSLPLNKDRPRLAVANLTCEEEPDTYWNPRFEKWADVDNTMHLVIQNPHREARFYEVKIWAVRKDRVVFDHIYPAVPDDTDQLVLSSNNGLPHFLIPGLDKGDNYSILLEVLDSNKTTLTHIPRVRNNPFTLNFTSTAWKATSSSSHQLDNRLVISVSTAVVVAVALLVCLVWKGVIRPSKLRNLVRNCAGKLSGTRRQRYISFTPIYCHENENFVAAVENHVTLLRRCVDTLTSEMAAPSDASLCCSEGSSQLWLDTTAKNHNIIIYLSPRLGEIVTCGPVPPAQCSKLDALCHQAILSLYELCQKGQGPIPVVVTFDCFKQAELAALRDLVALLFPIQSGEEGQQLTPLRLASFNSSGCTIENIEQVLARFQLQNEFLPQTADGFQGWREYAEVRTIERYLSILGDNTADHYREISADGQEGLCSVSENCDTSFHSYSSRLGPQALTRSVSDNLGENQEEAEFCVSQDGVSFLPDAPLISNSIGYHSGSDCNVSNSRVYNVPLTNNYNCAELSQDTAESSPKTSYLNDKVNSQSLYHQNQTEPKGYLSNNERSVPVKDGRASIHLQNIVKYKPNNFLDRSDKCDAFSVNSVESDSLLKSNDLSGRGRSVGQYFKDVSDDLEWGHQRAVKAAGSFIPPSLSHSNFTSMESVCERINRVNELSGWSELNLSK